MNTSFFSLSLVPTILRRIYSHWKAGKLSQLKSVRSFIAQIDAGIISEETTPFLTSDDDSDDDGQNLQDGLVERRKKETEAKLSLRETARLSLEFCLLWVRIDWSRVLWYNC